MTNPKSRNLPKTEWYEANAGPNQGLIVDEQTGENIAVTYKKENATLIVKACNHHEELVRALKDFVESYEACGECELAWAEAKELLAKVEGA